MSASSGFSLKKLIFRMLMLGLMAVTVLYAKTIGIFLKVFVQELMRSPKKESAE
jgi:hypothetical protein